MRAVGRFLRQQFHADCENPQQNWIDIAERTAKIAPYKENPSPAKRGKLHKFMSSIPEGAIQYSGKETSLNGHRFKWIGTPGH